MTTTAISNMSISDCLDDSQKEILSEWINQLLADEHRSKGVSDASLQSIAAEFLQLFRQAVRVGNLNDISSPEWEATKQMLADLSVSRAVQGSTPVETANFVLSLKQTLFNRLISRLGAGALASIWSLSSLLDRMALYTTEVFQKSREAIIRRQQKDMLEMSTPVIKLWEGILVVPLIGTLDSTRTQIVMESLLQRIVETASQIAILDITGVPTVDTQTAQHLMKTVSATRLMGADCIISGIRPQIAQTIVHLGIDIYDITTKATMGDAIKEALRRTGWVMKQTTEEESTPGHRYA
jgi:rsbT co-antagonist protein RsbR